MRSDDRRPRVLVADPLSESGLALLRRHCDTDVRTGLDRAALLAVVGDVHGLVIHSDTGADAELIRAATHLRVIAKAGIGLDNVDLAAATQRGILVCNAPQSNVVSAAEHTLALMLAAVRAIPAADRQLRGGTWARTGFQGVELYGKTVGILGLGRVGTLVAQRCQAFGMRVVAHDPYVAGERAGRIGVELVGSVLDLCRAADVVTLHLPLTPETTGIIGPIELAAMRPNAWLVNAARGGLVDEMALHDALVGGRIAGAALDVFTTEPPVDRALLALDNVVATPHLGAATAEARDKAGRLAAEAVVQALSGEVVASAVNIRAPAAVPATVRAFMPLARKLGRLLTALHRQALSELTVEYIGRVAAEPTEVLTLCALQGLLTDVSHEPVTFVNAPLLAEERGLRVATRTAIVAENHVSMIRLRAGEVAVAGTLAGTRDTERLVEVWGYDLDMELSDHMVFFRYSDRPGIIGVIGTRLGQAGVNIAAMQVGRHEAGGDQVAAMAIDSACPPGLVDEIAALIDAHEIRTLDLETHQRRP